MDQQFDSTYSAVADFGLNWGEFYGGLTQDDAGGLRYLFSSNNIVYETLLPDVHGYGSNAETYVDGALRPGVEKLTFVRQPWDNLLGQFLPLTNRFTDTYLTNSVAAQQQLERVTIQPDFLFCAADNGEGCPGTSAVICTSTTNWLNNAALNGAQGGAGPGVIRPPVRMTFHRLGTFFATHDTVPEHAPYYWGYQWGSFDASTNPPVTYPCPSFSGFDQMTLRLRLYNEDEYGDQTQRATYVWRLPSALGAQVALQTSTDLVNWASCAVVINQGAVVEWDHAGFGRPQRYFRLTPQ